MAQVTCPACEGHGFVDDKALQRRDKLSPDECKLVINRERIKAIRAVRERTGMGLKEAKDMVETETYILLRG